LVKKVEIRKIQENRKIQLTARRKDSDEEVFSSPSKRKQHTNGNAMAKHQI